MPTHIQSYYEISSGLFGAAALCAILVVMCIFRIRTLIEKNGVFRSVFYIVFVSALGCFFVWAGYRRSDNPIPKISLDNIGISCGPWAAPWSAITDIEFQQSLWPPVVQPFVRGGDSLLFKFDPLVVDTLGLSDYVKARRAVNCPIKELDTASDRVYAEIRAAWMSRKSIEVSR